MYDLQKKTCKYLNPNNITFSKYIVLGTGLAEIMFHLFLVNLFVNQDIQKVL